MEFEVRSTGWSLGPDRWGFPRPIAGAFGALKSALFQQRRVCPLAKRMAYQALVINLLLYGCESWALSAYMARRLAAFHRRCVRVMTGYTLDMGRVVHEVTGRRTSHAALYRRLGLPNMRTLLTCRRLQWLGHVFRMPPTRMPRKVLASWISCPRPVGRPYLSYGHSILTDLAQAHLRGDTWGYVASNRCRWRSLIESLKRSSSRSLRGRHRPCNPLLPLSLTSASGGNGAHVIPPPPPPPYPDGSMPTPPAFMAHDPDKFWERKFTVRSATVAMFSRPSCIDISLLMTVTVTVPVHAFDTWTHDANGQILLLILIWIKPNRT